MHELLAYSILASDPAGPSDNSLKIAIVTAVSVVIAAAITAIATTLQRRRDSGAAPASTSTAQDFISELLRRAEVAERRNTTLESQKDSLTNRVDELESICWRHGIDPDTGQSIPSASHPQ